VSNLTNLLAFSASKPLRSAWFSVVMALPWLVTIGIEYAVLRRMFRTDLAVGTGVEENPGGPQRPCSPWSCSGWAFAGFIVGSLGIEPVGGAGRDGGAGGARVGTAHGDGPGPDRLGVAAFRPFDAGPGGGGQGGGRPRLGDVGPPPAAVGEPGPALLAIAGTAVLANLINNLPAVLALLPLLAAAGPGPVLAGLIGVNLGPNLTYVGSLATLLWRRILQEHDHDAELGEFTRVGLITVPATLLGATVALWAMLTITGG
jgi:arsenical pump membrane protein